MKIKRAISVILAVLLCAATFAGCSSSNTPTLAETKATEAAQASAVSLTMGTSSTGGAVYGVGAGLAQVLNEKGKGLDIRAISTGGAVDNVGLMSRGEIQLACNASVVSGMAYAGQQEGLGAQTNLRGICSLYPSVLHIVATKASGLTSIKDFAGTKGAVGQSGGATDIYTRQVLSIADINYIDRKDLTPVFCDASEAAEQMKDGHIDWAQMALGVPGSAVTDLALSTEITIIPIEGEFRDQLIEKYPYYVPYTIPAGTYNGIDHDVETVACVITLVADESVDEETVYQITKGVWENLPDVQQIAASLSWMDPKNPAAGIGVPLHKGAERYYKEIGVLN